MVFEHWHFYGCKHQAGVIPCVLTLKQSLQKSKKKHINKLQWVKLLQFCVETISLSVVSRGTAFGINKKVNRLCIFPSRCTRRACSKMDYLIIASPDAWCVPPYKVSVLVANCFCAPSEQLPMLPQDLPEDMGSLKYVPCDLEGSVSISNKQGTFCLPSVNMSFDGFPRANVSVPCSRDTHFYCKAGPA